MRYRSLATAWATFCALSNTVLAQVSNPYHLNGSALQENCHCYTLTPDVHDQSGSVWNINKIDLRQSFDFNFNVYLGCHDDNGADGIVFGLQPISTSVGTAGQGLGFGGVSPSVGIAIDTYQNSDQADPDFDNISIIKNGNLNHGADDLAAPVPALATSNNIEDCQFHSFRVVWDPGTRLLKASVDGVDRVSATIDMVADIFNGDPMVFWGFTGSTGSLSNVQRVCTSLTPAFHSKEGVNVCAPAVVNFSDSSTSFGSIKKWIWDFGDGQVDNVATPSPHVYSLPGIYSVKLAIVGNDDCLSDTSTQTIVVGSKPVAAISYAPEQPCRGEPMRITDASTVRVGTVNGWTWNLNGLPYNVRDPEPIAFSGNLNASLRVSTLEGCVSDPVSETIHVRPLPCPAFYVPSAFSPNGDGHNDRFEYVAAGMASIDMFRIFNRSGRVVYSSTTSRGSWDGRCAGVPQPAGTYVYELKGRDAGGAVHFKKGTLILIR